MFTVNSKTNVVSIAEFWLGLHSRLKSCRKIEHSVSPEKVDLPLRRGRVSESK